MALPFFLVAALVLSCMGARISAATAPGCFSGERHFSFASVSTETRSDQRLRSVTCAVVLACRCADEAHGGWHLDFAVANVTVSTNAGRGAALDQRRRTKAADEALAADLSAPPSLSSSAGARGLRWTSFYQRPDGSVAFRGDVDDVGGAAASKKGGPGESASTFGRRVPTGGPALEFKRNLVQL